MRLAAACLAPICAVASLAGAPTASAGCDCGAPVAYLYPVVPAYAVQPVLVAQPVPQPIYVVNQGGPYPYPYVHGYEFYGRPHYYGGGWHGWRYAHPVRPPYHPYGVLEK